MNSLVSIIIPVFNAENYLRETIQSVLDQNYEHWELLVIDDGSTDSSLQIAEAFDDARIIIFSKENGGVSSARNLGLQHCKGDYVCFLDADDLLAEGSLKLRVNYFETHKDVAFVDGHVINFKGNSSHYHSIWKPSHKGSPLKELLKLTDSCFFGITWMIRRSFLDNHQFDPSLTFAEDLWLFIQISKDGGVYRYVDTPVYLRRLTKGSAMSNMVGLTEGYHNLFRKISQLDILNLSEKRKLKTKIKKIVIKSNLANGNLRLAIREIFL